MPRTGTRPCWWTAAGPVWWATFVPSAPWAPGQDYTVLFNPEHHLGVTDLAGNPFDPYRPPGFETD